MRWIHARAIDYHERNPWAIIWITLSPQNEAFIYKEWNPSPLKFVNYIIAEGIASRSGSQHYIMNLIDPLARKIQTNTGISVVEDLNRIFHQLKKEDLCSGGYWEPFDTKGSKGTDEIRKRLQNSVRVGRPYNNEVVDDGRKVVLPTLWISRECKETARSLKHWSYEDWATSKVAVVKDKKEVKAQKFSHFCTALEGIFKDNRFKPRANRSHQPTRRPKYFRVGGR